MQKKDKLEAPAAAPRRAIANRRRCGARTRRRTPYQSPAMQNGRWRMHGGASAGAPRGIRMRSATGHKGVGKERVQVMGDV
jgi:hypothetical protein